LTASFLDLVMFVIAVVFAVMGAKRGLIREVFRFAGVLGGFLVAFMYCRDMEAHMRGFSSNQHVVSVVAFLTVFLITFAVVMLVGLLLRKITEAVTLGWLDGLLGMALGLLKTAVIAWAVCLSIASLPVQQIQDQFSRSVVFRAYRAMPKAFSLTAMERTRDAFRRVKPVPKDEGDEAVNEMPINMEGTRPLTGPALPNLLMQSKC